MTTAVFDFAIGLNTDTLNTGISQLHSKHHDALFKGHDKQDISGTSGTIDWDIKKPPTVTLAAPTADQWNKAMDPKGNTPPADTRPTTNSFQIILTSTDVTVTVGAVKPYKVQDKDIGVYGQVSVSNGKLIVTILAVAIDEAGMKEWDRWAINHLVLPNIIKSANNSLSNLTIPTAELFGTKIELTLDEALVTGTHLVLSATANLDNSTTPDPLASDFTWPSDKPLWVLFSRRLVTKVLTSAIDTNKGGAKGNYSNPSGVVTVSVDYWLNSYRDLKLGDTTLTAGSAVLDMGYTADLSVLGLPPDKCSIIHAHKSM